jgi:tetratricopeptide (TPR) repeat protein
MRSWKTAPADALHAAPGTLPGASLRASLRASSSLLLALVVALPMAACRDNETAIARGDRLWADSAYDAALAEYRLAVAQRDDDHARARLAHAYARMGQLPEMRSLYQDLLPGNPALVDQAVYDFLHVGERAMRRGDVYSATMALDAAFQLRPELSPPAYILPVARFHRQRGTADRAEAYYVRALTTVPPDSAPRILYELGELHEEAGRCDVAVNYFTAFRSQGRQNERRWRTLLGEARWHTGNCSFRMAREARERGEATAALGHLETMLGLGEPGHLLDQAWMDRAEILYGIGRFEEALEAYRTVIDRSPTRTGPLVERAQRRIDEIRFGPQPEFEAMRPELRPDG